MANEPTDALLLAGLAAGAVALDFLFVSERQSLASLAVLMAYVAGAAYLAEGGVIFNAVLALIFLLAFLRCRGDGFQPPRPKSARDAFDDDLRDGESDGDGDDKDRAAGGDADADGDQDGEEDDAPPAPARGSTQRRR